MLGTALKGKVAVVTGASRGIGEEIAARLASEGARVAVTARSIEQTHAALPGTIHTTVERIKALGGEAVAIQGDLAQQVDRIRIIEEAENQLGPIDILVSNAAVTYFVPVADFRQKHYELMFEVQVRAPFEMAQAVIPGMRERGGGAILNISSGAARHPQGPPYPARGGRGGTVYGMCKAALERFTTGLAAELYDDNISVNVLSPSKVVPTPGVLFHKLVESKDDPRAEGPEVMAEAGLVLVSGDPKVVTGKIAYSQAILDEFGQEAVVAA